MKQKNARTGGYAMILVICVMALVVALCLSLLMTAAAVYSGAQQESRAEQCRILTVSVSQQLQAQLLKPEYNDFHDSAAEAAADDGTLWFFLRREMQGGTWAYFNENESGHTAREAYRTYTFSDGIPAQLADAENLEIVMYWESENGASFAGALLHINVTCQMNGQKCTVQSEYLLRVNGLSDADGSEVQNTPTAYEAWAWSLNRRS